MLLTTTLTTNGVDNASVFEPNGDDVDVDNIFALIVDDNGDDDTDDVDNVFAVVVGIDVDNDDDVDGDNKSAVVVDDVVDNIFALVVDDNVLTGFHSVEDLETLIQESFKLQIAKPKIESTQ